MVSRWRYRSTRRSGATSGRRPSTSVWESCNRASRPCAGQRNEMATSISRHSWPAPRSWKPTWRRSCRRSRTGTHSMPKIPPKAARPGAPLADLRRAGSESGRSARGHPTGAGRRARAQHPHLRQRQSREARSASTPSGRTRRSGGATTIRCGAPPEPPATATKRSTQLYDARGRRGPAEGRQVRSHDGDEAAPGPWTGGTPAQTKRRYPLAECVEVVRTG